MSFKPTLVLVPGALHSASTWDKMTSLLEKQQYKSISICLPTTASDPTATFADDIDAVRRSIIAETSRGRDVVVVGHSYGGPVGSSAIKGLTRASRTTPAAENGSTGHVLGLVMIAASFIETGQSILENIGGTPPPSWNLESEFADVAGDSRDLFYHDLPVEEGESWVSRLRKQSTKSLTEGGEHAYAGWMDVPVWYLATRQDKALPIEAQQVLVEKAKASGASITVRDIESSHSPMLSKPHEVVDFLSEAIADFVR